jgi:hypothetical protein
MESLTVELKKNDKRLIYQQRPQRLQYLLFINIGGCTDASARCQALLKIDTQSLRPSKPRAMLGLLFRQLGRLLRLV